MEAYLFDLSSSGSKPGLERINTLLKALGNPEVGLKYVHICGTNGKGSTSLIMANILKASGYKAGRFTSPHIHSYLERFTINGEMITARELKNYIDEIELVINRVFTDDIVRPTEFELLTAIAFKWFQDKKVDIAVVEVGMGGLYDSTNVIMPEVSIITSVDIDHVEFLGNTMEEIAYNKAGIIKKETPVVVGELSPEAYGVIAEKAGQENAPLYKAGLTKVLNAVPRGLKGYDIDVKTDYLELEKTYYSLAGDYQLENITTALTAVGVLKHKGYNIAKEDIVNALGCLQIRGRLEVVRSEPLVIVDVAHNPHAARAIGKALNNLLPGKPKVVLCGIVDDKDAKNILSSLGDNTVHCVITRPAGRRGQEWLRLKSIWRELYPEKPVYAVEDIEQAVSYSLNLLKDEEYLLICGSFYVLDKARRIFTNC